MAAPRDGGLFSVQTLPGWTPLDGSSTVPPSVPSKAGAPAPALAPPASKHSPSRTVPAGKAAADDVSWVQTAEDVISYFDRWGEEAPVQFFYCLRGHDAAAATEFFLRVVSPAKTTNLPSYYIMSRRQLVRVDRRSGEHTDTVPLEEWAAHKRAYLRLKELTFFGSFSLAKCFHRWRNNYHTLRMCRRRNAVQATLLHIRPSFQEALLEAARLLVALRAVRTAQVLPHQLYSAAEWAEQQDYRRQRKVQPEVETTVAALVRLAERVCSQVEGAAEHMLAAVKPWELGDRIGVDLYAATSSAKHRSMQQIREEKEARAGAYARAMAERSQLPAFLRMLDLQLAGALAGMAVGSVAEAASALQAAAPGLLLHEAGGAESGALEGDMFSGSDSDDSQASSTSEAAADSSPAFVCNLVVDGNGSIAFSPSEGEWVAAVHEEVVGAALRLAGGVQALLMLPSFQQYQQAACGAEEATASKQDCQQAGIIAQQDGVFVAAAVQLTAMVERSFVRARQVAPQYQPYLAIHQFGGTWSYDAWAEQQRVAIDLPGCEALLRQLRAWQQLLDDMVLAQPAGLLSLDATSLQASLQPVVTAAHDGITSLLLQLASEQCCQLLVELNKWQEVAAARPPDLEAGFLPWTAELAHMQQELGAQLAAAAAIDAALELVAVFSGRLPTADAVKRDDLREVAAALPAALGAAAAWQAEQREVHAATVGEQARLLAEEAMQLEGEIKMGAYEDAGAPVAEVLSELELQQEHLTSVAAQAEGLAQLLAELSEEPSGGKEIGDAEAALGRCMALWHLVADGEALHTLLAMPESTTEELESNEPRPPPPSHDEASRKLAALQERLVGLRVDGAAPGSVWVRASNALLACQTLLEGHSG